MWIAITGLTMSNNKYFDGEEGGFLGFEPREVVIAHKRLLRRSLRVKQMGALVDYSRSSLSEFMTFQLARQRLLNGVCQIKGCNHSVEYSGVIIYEPIKV